MRALRHTQGKEREEEGEGTREREREVGTINVCVGPYLLLIYIFYFI